MALADAHVLAVRLYLSKATAESAMTPGPPLPKSHPPPALIAKIYLECVSLYSSALALALTPSKTKSPTPSRAATNSPSKSSSSHTLSFGKSTSSSSYEISPDLRSYLSSEIHYTTALAHKWLGVDAGENGKQARAGEAVAFLALAKSELEEAKGGGIKGIGKGISGGWREKERKERVTTELESVNVFLKYYKKMNDSVSYLLDVAFVVSYRPVSFISNPFPTRQHFRHLFLQVAPQLILFRTSRLLQHLDQVRSNIHNG